MPLYRFVVVAAVLITSFLIWVALKRKQLASPPFVIGILISAVLTLTIGLCFPITLSTLVQRGILQVILAILIVLLLHTTVIFLVSIFLASHLLKAYHSRKTQKNKLTADDEKVLLKIEKKLKASREKKNHVPEAVEAAGTVPVTIPEATVIIPVAASEAIPTAPAAVFEAVEIAPAAVPVVVETVPTIMPYEVEQPPLIEQPHPQIDVSPSEPIPETISDLLAATSAIDLSETITPAETMPQDVTNFAEKDIDTDDNTDTMGIELDHISDQVDHAVAHIESNEKDPVDIQELMDHAFEYKSVGQFSEAVSCYYSILAEKPDSKLVFWVVLDICILYKKLGQIALAKDILLQYLNVYGDSMDEQIKSQILLNLT